ncbi:MAG: hypothetical protein V7K86_14570 [Nostoc sp.]|uniref:hypothetical protein n=1 Tax=Nostoc sp. TaxID=1180 RepID=UPI002FF6A570
MQLHKKLVLLISQSGQRERKNKKIIRKFQKAKISEKLEIVEMGLANIKTLTINSITFKWGQLYLKTLNFMFRKP